jgi:hypothetical protein
MDGKIVEERLIEAAEILKRTPAVRVQGYFSLWPKIAPTFDDLVGQKPQMRRPLPSPTAIDRMEETLDWFKWLEPPDTKIVWLKALENHLLLPGGPVAANGTAALGCRAMRDRAQAQWSACAEAPLADADTNSPDAGLAMRIGITVAVSLHQSR